MNDDIKAIHASASWMLISVTNDFWLSFHPLYDKSIQTAKSEIHNWSVKSFICDIRFWLNLISHDVTWKLHQTMWRLKCTLLREIGNFIPKILWKVENRHYADSWGSTYISMQLGLISGLKERNIEIQRKQIMLLLIFEIERTFVWSNHPLTCAVGFFLRISKQILKNHSCLNNTWV